MKTGKKVTLKNGTDQAFTIMAMDGDTLTLTDGTPDGTFIAKAGECAMAMLVNTNIKP